MTARPQPARPAGAPASPSGQQHSIIHLCARTDTGLVRERNEDAVGSVRIATVAGDPIDMLIVADGMGGTSGGSTAAVLAVERVGEQLARLSALFADPTDEWQRAVNAWLLDAITEANSAVRQLAFDQPALAGMGSTLIVGVIVNGWLGLAWVGDSRAYLRRSHQFVQLTVDHTWALEEQRRGALSIDDINASPYRAMVTRGIGLGADIVPETRWMSLEPGDRLLLTTDGLTGYVDGPMLAQHLDRCQDVNTAADYLISLANASGGSDNTSVIVVDITTPGVKSLPAPRPVTEINAPLIVWDVPPPHRPAPTPTARPHQAATPKGRPVKGRRAPARLLAGAGVSAVVLAAVLWAGQVLPWQRVGETTDPTNDSASVSRGDDASGRIDRTGIGRVAAGRLLPRDTAIVVGRQIAYRLELTDSLLEPLRDLDVVWGSSDSATAAPSPNGRVRAIKLGDSVRITALVAGRRFESVLHIRPDDAVTPARNARESLPRERPDR